MIFLIKLEGIAEARRNLLSSTESKLMNGWIEADIQCAICKGLQVFEHRVIFAAFLCCPFELGLSFSLGRYQIYTIAIELESQGLS